MGDERVLAAIDALIDWARGVVEGSGEPGGRPRKTRVVTKPARRGYKRGPYHKRASGKTDAA